MPKIDKDPNNEKLPKELQEALQEIVEICMKEDAAVRKNQVRMWKKAEEFWAGIQYIFWSEARMEWLNPASLNYTELDENREGSEGPFYDYVINIYRAHGESIIAALSAQVPAVRFPPDDAESIEDLTTSKTYSKIAELIQRHSKIKLIILKALFMAWNQGTFYSYHAPKSDKKYGTTEIPQYEKIKKCPNCEIPEETNDDVNSESQGAYPGDVGNIDSVPPDMGIPEMDEEDLYSSLPGQPQEVPQDPNTCPQCGSPKIDTVQIAGFSESPKRRINIEVYGGLNVKVPFRATCQDECGYLSLIVDKPKDYLKSIYPNCEEKIDKEDSEMGSYEREIRSPSTRTASDASNENNNLIPLQRIWLRPWRFNLLGETKKELRDELAKKFPDGCYVALVGKTYLESRNECMDKYWTVGIPGLAPTIHCDALGKPLISIQELRNVLINLTEETIEHGIPSGYADTKYLNFDAYSKHEATPGSVYPISVPDGKKASDGFYESSRATLSEQVPAFGDQLDKDGQFVVGSFPSIYGGPGEGNSRTAAEYNMSRQMALQRLSIVWSLITIWFCYLMEKTVKLFIETMTEDEKFVKHEKGNYINVWIRQSELEGRVGDVEPEGSETFPVSSPQKQELLLKLLGMNNDFLNAAIFDTENRRTVSDVLSFPDMYIPGDDQRTKQIKEIYRMIQGIQVPIEPEVDDDQIHVTTLKSFLVGSAGMDLKDTDPNAYEMCKMHLAEHQQSLQMKTMQQFESQVPGQAPQVGVE